MSRVSRANQERVAEAEKTATEMMKKAGFDVGDRIKISVDPKLPFMGYSRPDGRGYMIVVSGAAVDSGMLEGLILHELSHIYRMRTGHPSHDAKIMEEAVASLGKQAVLHDYQKRIIFSLSNNVQDLYADDIAIPIMKESGRIAPDILSRFLQDWVKDEPANGKDTANLRWENAWLLANNARAIGQMTRHGVVDLDGMAADRNRLFLSRIDPSMASKFAYFLEFLTSLREDVTVDVYRRLLEDYLGNFVRMAQEAPFPSASPGRR